MALAAASVAMLFSCENANVLSSYDEAETYIEATYNDSSVETKTAISEMVGSAVKFTWLAGDAINVFFGASESSIFVTNTTDRVAQFKGTIGAVTGGGDDLNDETSLWGAYPYNRNNTCDGSSVTISLPHLQEAKADNFADDLFPSVARSQNFTMAFYPVCGSFRFKVSNPDIIKVTLSGNNNENLAGKAKVNMALGGTPEIVEISEGYKELVMEAPDGGCFETGKYYYFVLYPSELSKGYTLTYYKKDRKDSFVKQEAYPIGRNKFGGKTEGDKGLDSETPWSNGNGESGESSIKVQAIYMITESATLAPGTSYVLDTDYEPYNATNTTWKWSSSDASVAYVDESGKVSAIADGETTITATATDGSGVSASSTITVKAITAVASAEYKDEYGVNHGRGVAIGDVVWAPVNCGYKAPTVDIQGNVTDKGYPYGKLYQWGRKYGQGYSYSLEYDATTPSEEDGTLVEGPVKISVGQLEANADKFYMSTSSPCDWALFQNDKLWNDGTEDEPKKTDYDPCPDGWRVPTYNELDALCENYSSWTTADEKSGRWFSDIYTYQDEAPQSFFPAAGRRCCNGVADTRGTYGHYWCSRPYGDGATTLTFSSGGVYVGVASHDRGYGYSVRCVQE